MVWSCCVDDLSRVVLRDSRTESTLNQSYYPSFTLTSDLVTLNQSENIIFGFFNGLIFFVIPKSKISWHNDTTLVFKLHMKNRIILETYYDRLENWVQKWKNLHNSNSRNFTNNELTSREWSFSEMVKHLWQQLPHWLIVLIWDFGIKHNT